MVLCSKVMTCHFLIEKYSIIPGEETYCVGCTVLYLMYLVEKILFNKKDCPKCYNVLNNLKFYSPILFFNTSFFLLKTIFKLKYILIIYFASPKSFQILSSNPCYFYFFSKTKRNPNTTNRNLKT